MTGQPRPFSSAVGFSRHLHQTRAAVRAHQQAIFRAAMENRGSARTLGRVSETEQVRFQVDGYLHPLFGAERVLRKFPAYHALNSLNVPCIDCRGWFLNPHQAPLHQTLVKYGRRQFLIIFYQDDRVCVNSSITSFVDLGLENNRACPSWRGELAVFELGRQVFFLSRPGSKLILRKVLRLFLCRAMEASLLERVFPKNLNAA